jgi:GntR family transcriptional regulator of gluconate operon
MPELLFQERWEVVHEEIRRRILSGDLAPGTALPETELADGLGVSRGPVREALRSLEVAGLVERRPRRPSIVTPITEADVEELFSVRQPLEILALERAMSHNLGQLVPALTARLERMRSAIATGASHDVFVEEDVAFHGTFYEFSANRRLESIWATLRDPVRMIMNLSVQFGSPDWPRILGEHEHVAEIVARGDRESVRVATQEHLDSAFERAREYVRTAEARASAV